MTTELQKWLAAQGEVDTAEFRVPPHIIRAMLTQSVIDNWPTYEVVENSMTGEPVVLRFGSPTAANKALEMLAKDAGMLDNHVDVSGRIELVINGVNTEALK